MVSPCGGTNASGASSCASPSQSSSEILDDGGDQSRLEVDKALARGRQTLQIEAKLSISIRYSSIRTIPLDDLLSIITNYIR